MRARWLVSLLLAGCVSTDAPDDLDDDAWLDGKGDGTTAVAIAGTSLDVDLGGKTAVATIELERNGHVELEVKGLAIEEVTDRRGRRRHTITNGKLRVSNVRGPLVIRYAFTQQANADGLLANGSTVIWPYFCGNLFPCHSQPADGTTFELALDNVPAGQTAVFPEAIAADAPAYQIAWAVGDYQKLALGTTAAGTSVSAFYLPGGKTAATAGTKNLVEVFDWFEQTLGPYAFGRDVASVSVNWDEGLFGGMEHHPYWHVAKDAMSDEVTHAHEAAHGWFGDAVRIRCWEDFVLSEGTVSYLAARALSVVDPSKEAGIWAEYEAELEAAIAEGGAPAWPEGCNRIDILKDRLFTNLPYMQGAFFYKDVADAVGADVLDGVISKFYLAHRNQPGSMQEMVELIERETGFDPTPIAERRLRTQF